MTKIIGEKLIDLNKICFVARKYTEPHKTPEGYYIMFDGNISLDITDDEYEKIKALFHNQR